MASVHLKLSEMTDANPVKPGDRSDRPSNPVESLVDHIMTPGSTVVSPTFLLMVDITLGSLLFLFLALLVLTWSFHFVALGVITVGLWGSVKLCVVLVKFSCITTCDKTHPYPPFHQVCRGITEGERTAGSRC